MWCMLCIDTICICNTTCIMYRSTLEHAASLPGMWRHQPPRAPCASPRPRRPAKPHILCLLGSKAKPALAAQQMPAHQPSRGHAASARASRTVSTRRIATPPNAGLG
jgi:hypothetical protein